MNARMTLDEVKAAGGVFVRGEFPFGKCDAYRLPDGTMRYQLGAEYVTWNILAADLRESWVPQAGEDRRWKSDNVG